MKKNGFVLKLKPLSEIENAWQYKLTQKIQLTIIFKKKNSHCVYLLLFEH